MKYISLSLFYFLSISNLFAQEIKVYTWENFLSEAVVNAFTQKTGHTIKQHFYDSEVDRNAILMNDLAAKYDLVLVDSAATIRYGQLGVLQQLSSVPIDNVQYNGQNYCR